MILTLKMMFHVSKAPHIQKQNKLNDLIRNLGLTKAKAELLTSHLKKWNLLHPACKVSNLNQERVIRHLQLFLSENPLLHYCADKIGLFQKIGTNYFVPD